jgi:hypothetical protein
MPLPYKFRRPQPKGRYTDNDETARTRARGIDQLRRSYATGGYYDDITSKPPPDDQAQKDYDMLARTRKYKFSKPTKAR